MSSGSSWGSTLMAKPQATSQAIPSPCLPMEKRLQLAHLLTAETVQSLGMSKFIGGQVQRGANLGRISTVR